MSIIRYFNPNTLESIKLKNGYIKSTPIVRSEGFLLQYRHWKKSYAAMLLLHQMRELYEQSFFDDEINNLQVKETANTSAIKFCNITNVLTPQGFYLLDLMKEGICNNFGLQVFRTESIKALQADETLVLKQRYWLSSPRSWFKRLFNSGIFKQNWVVIEAVLFEDKHVELQLKTVQNQQDSAKIGIHELMQTLLKSA